jgi:hypothetical protein
MRGSEPRTDQSSSKLKPHSLWRWFAQRGSDLANNASEILWSSVCYDSTSTRLLVTIPQLDVAVKLFASAFSPVRNLAV